MDYEKVISALLEELRRNPSIEILKEGISFGLDEKYIKNRFRNAGLTVAESIIKYFSSIDTVNIEWKSKVLENLLTSVEPVFGNIICYQSKLY